MSRIPLLIGSWLFVSTAIAQTKLADSLRLIIHQAPTEKAELAAMLALCEEFQGLDRDTLDYYAYRAKALAHKIGGKKNISLAGLALSYDYYRWGWSDSALAELATVMERHPVTDPGGRDIYFKAARMKALTYGSKSKYAEALQLLYSLVREAERYRDTFALSSNLNTIGSIALQRESPAAGMRYFNNALACLAADARYDPVRAAIYVNMGNALLQQHKMDSALLLMNKGVAGLRNSNNLMALAIALQRQSDLFLKGGRITEAETALKEMIAVRSRLNDGDIWVDDNLSLVDFYINTNQVDKAIDFCKRMLVTGDVYNFTGEAKIYNNSTGLRLEYQQALARCYRIKKDDSLYAATLEQIIQLKDSFYTASSEQAIAEVQTKYEVERKENTIIQQELEIARKNNLLLVSGLSALFLTVTGWLLFRDYRRRQRLRLEKVIENEKTLAVKAVADAEEKERKRIAADLHDNLGAYAASIASNIDFLDTDNLNEKNQLALKELNDNSQSMVSRLSDTIWALNRDTLTLTALSDRIKLLLNRVGKSYPGISMEVQEDITEDLELPPTQAFHLFQITGEAVTNALKHSGATRLTITVEGHRHWRIQIADNGRGMTESVSPAGGGNGLGNMRRRAAISGWRISWSGGQPSGTVVTIQPAVQ